MDVTKEEFEAFDRVRASGRINMFDAINGCMLSGLTRERWNAVMRNYNECMKKWPDVKKEE